MPVIFPLQSRRRAAALRSRAGCSASVADEIAQAEAIDRLTLWPTLRIRACLGPNAAPPAKLSAEPAGTAPTARFQPVPEGNDYGSRP